MGAICTAVQRTERVIETSHTMVLLAVLFVVFFALAVVFVLPVTSWSTAPGCEVRSIWGRLFLISVISSSRLAAWASAPTPRKVCAIISIVCSEGILYDVKMALGSLGVGHSISISF